MILPGVSKIAVLRANGLGDWMFAVPALDALRAAYPNAETVLLGRPWHAQFLEGRPGPIDRVIVVPPSKGVREEEGSGELHPQEQNRAELERFFGAMRDEHFDLAIQLHGGGYYSNPFLLQLGARATAGLRTADAAMLDRWVPYVYFQSETLRCLEVVSLVGAQPQELEPRINVTPQDLQASLQVCPESDKPLVAIHPGASDPRRRWPPISFAAVGDALTAAGAHVVVTGTASERPLVDAMLRSMSSPAEDLCARLDVNGLAGLLSRCRLVVANDTGPLHLAAAVGAATVGVYWCGNLINADPITRTRHRPILSWRLECPICGRNTIHDNCQHRISFVADVPVDQVVDVALSFLNPPPESQ
jgi:ADP-heptose:LPS heptosyltransferase